MTFKNRDIWQYSPPLSGIKIGNSVMEEAAALTWAGHRVTDDIDYNERILIKAMYRTQNQMDAVKAHDDAKRMERARKR